MVAEDSCDGCQRAATANKPSNYNDLLERLSEPIPHLRWDWDSTAEIPSCCRNCSNHPSNGGSGICHCTLPYATENPIKYDYQGYEITTCTSENYIVK